MSITGVRTPTEYEERLARYLFERSEEGRAVRVGEKETSEQAAIVERYRDLFSTEQLEVLRDAEDESGDDERELLYRLRKTCEGGIVSAELAAREDELENRILAARVPWQGEELPLRSAQAKLAVLPGYRDRDELGALATAASAGFNDDRRELLAAGEALEAELSGEPDAVARNEEEKGISLQELERALDAASRRLDERLWTRCASAGSSSCSAPTARMSRRRATRATCAGSRRSRRRTRRSGLSPSAPRRSRRSGSTSSSCRGSSSTSTTGRRSRRAHA